MRLIHMDNHEARAIAQHGNATASDKNARLTLEEFASFISAVERFHAPDPRDVVSARLVQTLQSEAVCASLSPRVCGAACELLLFDRAANPRFFGSSTRPEYS